MSLYQHQPDGGQAGHAGAEDEHVTDGPARVFRRCAGGRFAGWHRPDHYPDAGAEHERRRVPADSQRVAPIAENCCEGCGDDACRQCHREQARRRMSRSIGHRRDGKPSRLTLPRALSGGRAADIARHAAQYSAAQHRQQGSDAYRVIG